MPVIPAQAGIHLLELPGLAFAGITTDKDSLEITSDCLPMTLSMPDIARTILMHRSVRLGMRLAAVLIIVRFISELASPHGGAFAKFEWWVPISLIIVPWYFAFELKWSAAAERKGSLLFLLFAFLLPGLLAILVVLGMFVAHWIPALRILFR